MKIGIFTFMQSNYGAVLQAAALRLFLKEELNADVEVVNFTTDSHLSDNKVIKKRSPIFLKNLYYFLFSLLRYRQLSTRKKKTELFKASYLNLSKRYKTVEELLSNPPTEDIYITGSDQVFNPGKEYLPVYYLGFCKKEGRKVAYSPSFGISTFSEDFKNVITPYIKDFDFLSCREQSGSDFITQIIGKEVPTLLDPVTLLSKEKWSSIANPPHIKSEYIFVYNLNGGYDLIKYANLLKDRTGLKIVCLASNITHFYNVDTQMYNAGPAEFLGYIRDAQYVITDSFHGTMFSLIFNKKFSTLISTLSTSSRITNILGKLGLQDHISLDATKINFDSIDKNYSVDFDKISNTSKMYLRKSCSL